MSILTEPVLGKFPERIHISNSEIQTFKSCRRRWFLGNYLGLTLNERSEVGPLPLGTRIHDSLEQYYLSMMGKGEIVNPVDVYNRLQREDNLRFLETSESSQDDKIKKFNDESELGRIMLEGYMDWMDEENPDADLEVVGAETKLGYVLEGFDNRVELIGKVDLQVRRLEDGSRATLDHKALHIDQQILTPTGYRRIGDAKVGDKLIAPDGSVTTITGVFPQGTVHLNKVTFNDHTSILACDDHLWGVYGVKSKDSEKPYSVMRTEDLKDRIVQTNKAGARVRQYAVPLVSNIEFPERQLPINPYLLGALLGDGHFGSQIRLTTWDRQILTEGLKGSELDLDYYEKTKNEFVIFDRWTKNTVVDNKIKRVFPLKDALATLGLVDSRSHDKFVPDVYKYASADQRLSILQGIMDTDGFVRNYSEKSGGTLALYCTSEQLVNDVAWLVRSLGGFATVNQNPKATKLHKSDGSVKLCRTGFYVSIRMPENLCPFRLQRKVDGFNQFKRRVGYRTFDRIEDAGFGEAVCITVDHPDKLFITDDFVVTHNSALQFTDYYKYAHQSEQLMMYTMLQRLDESHDGSRIDGGIYNLLKKVKRSSRAVPPFYERIDVRFNEKTLDAFWIRTLGTIRDIMVVRDALDNGADHRYVAYPTPTMDWKTGSSPFFPVYSMLDDGSNVEAYLEDHFHQHNPNARYEVTEKTN